MIIHCTTPQQIEDVIKTESMNMLYASPEKIFKSYGSNSCINNGSYGSLDFYKSYGYTITPYVEWKENKMKDLQVDVNTKKIIESIKQLKLKDAITLLQSQGYKVEAPYVEPTDEEICERIKFENSKIGYAPDWNDSTECKYCIEHYRVYDVDGTFDFKTLGTIYTTKEIATQIVVELNEKRFERVSE